MTGDLNKLVLVKIKAMEAKASCIRGSAAYESVNSKYSETEEEQKPTLFLL